MAIGQMETMETKGERRSILDILEIKDCEQEPSVWLCLYELTCGLKITNTLVARGVVIRDYRGRFQPTSLLRDVHKKHHDKYPDNDQPWTIEVDVDNHGHWVLARDCAV